MNFSKESNFLVFGVTNCHCCGGGYMSDVWTVFQGDNSEK
jgi:hypothetical protein